MKSLNACWQKKARAWKVFWIGAFLLLITFFIISFSAMSIFDADKLTDEQIDKIVRPLTALISAFVLFWAILLWKNAFNCKAKIWAYLNRIIAGCVIISSSVPIISYAAMSIFDIPKAIN